MSKGSEIKTQDLEMRAVTRKPPPHSSKLAMRKQIYDCSLQSLQILQKYGIAKCSGLTDRGSSHNSAAD